MPYGGGEYSIIFLSEGAIYPELFWSSRITCWELGGGTDRGRRLEIPGILDMNDEGMCFILYEENYLKGFTSQMCCLSLSKFTLLAWCLDRE